MKNFNEHVEDLEDLVVENTAAKEMIKTFDASEKGARGKFIAKAVAELGMKSTTAGAFWQRNKKLATGGTNAAPANKPTKKPTSVIGKKVVWSIEHDGTKGRAKFGTNTINGKGEVGVGGHNYKMYGLGAWDISQYGTYLEAGVSVFENGYVHMSGSPAVKVTSKVIAKRYIDAAKSLIGIGEITAKDVSNYAARVEAHLKKHEQANKETDAAGKLFDEANQAANDAIKALYRLMDAGLKLPKRSDDMYYFENLRYDINKMVDQIHSIQKETNSRKN